MSITIDTMGFPGGSVVKNLPANAGDAGSIPGSGSYPGEGNGHSLQYSCLENFVDRGDQQATVHGVAKSQTRLNEYHSLTYIIVIYYTYSVQSLSRVRLFVPP